MTIVRRALAALLVGAVSACGAPTAPAAAPTSTQAAPASTPQPTTPPTTAATPAPTPPTSAPDAPRPRVVRRLDGIDVSHHQGAIDWSRVADDAIEFAYLKATEGSTFDDPRFAEHWREASAAGLRVGGYHYFTLCADPLPQADHFADALDAVATSRRTLPPVVDLELIGNCDPPPAEAPLRAAVEAFVDEVERRTGQPVVVYTHPDFDDRYPGLADGLDRRRWVRLPGERQPPGDWFVWQRSDDATVNGIDGPVDLDLMRLPSRPAGQGGGAGG